MLNKFKLSVIGMAALTCLTFGAIQNVEAAPVGVVGFAHINFPSNVAGDEFVVKSAYFSMKQRANKIQGVKINYDGSLKNDAYVIGTISKYKLLRIWHDPKVVAVAKEVSSSKSDWYDKNGKKHTKTTTNYREEAEGKYGYTEFKGVVEAEFQLIDARTNQLIVDHYDTAYDDKESDALNHILRSFYKKVNKALKGE